MSLKLIYNRCLLRSNSLSIALLVILFILFICSGSMAQSGTVTVYEDAENGLIDKWDIYDNTPTGATVTNVFDTDKNSQVIELTGLDRQNGFRIGSNSQSNSRAWKNTTQTVIQWDAKAGDLIYYYVAVQTDHGFRFLGYIPRNKDVGINTIGNFIRFGIGYNTINGEWHTITRDLSADLKKFEPDNNIIEVNGLLIRGHGRLDNIQMLDELPDGLPSAFPHLSADPIYEDAEDGSIFGWDVYDSDPEGAVINNVFDDEKNSHVIELSGDGIKNGYRIGSNSQFNPRAWANNKQTIIQWDAKFDDLVSYFIAVQTDLGFRYLNYTPRNNDLGVNTTGNVIRFGIGYDRINGEWHTITRDLSADLKKFEPNNNIIEVNGILLRGSGRLDNIQMLDETPDSISTSQASVVLETIYEDAEDETIFAWDIYDQTPEGAMITNVFDVEKNSRVIQLSGSERQNGYRLGSNSQNNIRAWKNSTHNIIEWDAKFDETFDIFIAVQTLDGFRFFHFTPIDNDLGISPSGTFIRIGLGSEAISGGWRSYQRYLSSDLKMFEPNNRIIEVNGMSIRGSGRLDNIKMLKPIDVNPIFHGVSTGFQGIPNTEDDVVNVTAVLGIDGFSNSEGSAQSLAVRVDTDENIIFYSTEGVLPLGLEGIEVKDCCDGSEVTLFHIGSDQTNGAPAETGTFIYKVKATDVDGFEDEVTFNITVVDP